MNKEIESIYKVIETKAKNFTKQELEELIISQGYKKEIAKEVIKELDKNKVAFKGDKPQVKTEDKTKTEDKEKILKEISSSVKKENPKKQNPKKQNPVINFFKRIYFFFEDIYYSIIDGISKIIPVNKATDQIDKVFPSFILFILLIIGIIWLIVFSGVASTFGTIGATIDITVTDTANNLLSGSTVIISINDKNTTQTTDTFGNTVFESISLRKKDNIQLIVSKEAYNTKTKNLTASKKIIETVALDIDTQPHLIHTPEQTRNLVFKENSTLVVTKLLQVRLSCSNSGKTPSPPAVNITTGTLSVIQPAGCGFLRIDVISDHYNLIQNQLVSEDNIIMLSPKSLSNTGKIEVFVKGLSGNAIPGTQVSLFPTNDPNTPVNESNIVFSRGTTDHYGRYLFETISPGQYQLSATKDGFIDSSRENAQVSINNTSVINILLLSPTDLQNINCQNLIFSRFCANGCLDCNNALLANYYLRDANRNLIKTGNCCQIGSLGYLNITLVDANGISTREIKGDITIFKRNIDGNNFQSIATRRDVNFSTFYLLKGNNYRLAVTNTEDYGYFPPSPIDINALDRNIQIPLEYSSRLNTGSIGTNVRRNNFPSFAHVYLYNSDDSDIPIRNGQTNSNGDINFSLVRANRDYFTYAISGSNQGQSNTRELDANKHLQLPVSLSERAKILNLQVNASDYNIEFYSLTSQRITDYTVVTKSDTNKEYIFRSPQNEVYAIINARNRATYQTHIITLIPGQTVHYRVVLINPQNNAHSSLEFLGIYDQSGQRIERINLVEDRFKTFRLKYKFSTTTESNRDYAYALIRAGKHITLSSDFIKLGNVFAPGTTLTRGCNYQGQTTDWNEAHFFAYYDRDHTQTNCSNQSGSKWVKINFSNTSAEQIEFSVDFNFQNGLTPLENYAIYSKALTRTNTENYAFHPTLNASWQNCTIRPQGYFYSPFIQNPLVFEGNNNLLTTFYDWNGTQGNIITQNGTSYIFNIGKRYLYTQKFLYLDNAQNLNNKPINAYSRNTDNRLLYNSYNFRVVAGGHGGTTSASSTLNAINYTIAGINARFGTEIDHNSVFLVNSFFNSSATIDTNILEISNYRPHSKNILAYYADSNVFIEILTNDHNNQNNVYAGDNNISFRVRTNIGQPISGIVVKYNVGLNPQVLLGNTNTNGYLLDRNISLSHSQIGHQIIFSFEFPVSYGFVGNRVVIPKTIMSGISLIHSTGLPISDLNPITYSVGKYIYNGVTEKTEQEKEYFIFKKTAHNPLLSNISISHRNQSGSLNITDMNNYLFLNNTIPRTITEPTTTIKTKSKVNNILTNFNVGAYNNLINIGVINGEPITISLLAPIRLFKAFDVNINTSLSGITKPGKRSQNNKIHIELIKEKATGVDFNYTITNNSNTPIRIDINSEKSNDLNAVNIIASPSNVLLNANQSRTINIKLLLANNATHVLDKNANVFFNYRINDINFTKKQELSVSVYDVNGIYSIQNIIPPGPNFQITCSSTECSSHLIARIINRTKTYDFNFTNISFIDNDGNFIIKRVNPTLAFDLNSTINANAERSPTITIDGNYTKLKGNRQISYNQIFNKNKVIRYSFNLRGINNSNIDKNIQMIFNITLINQTIQQILEEHGLYGDICFGVGASPVLTNQQFNILGYCEDHTFDACKRGTEHKPKIEFNWAVNAGWSSKCVDTDPEDYNKNKTHCDSLQMLYGVFTLINNNAQELKDGQNYIYLMYDGVSQDLLLDYINLGFLQGIYNHMLTVENITSNKLNISRTEIINGVEVNTRKPGKYQIKINESYSSDPDHPNNRLHIQLKLIREMPYTMRNLLYYIPINGTLGVDNTNKRMHRNGYGVSIANDANLPIDLSHGNTARLYKNAYGNNSAVKLTVNNYDNTKDEGLRKTINSDGKLLDIKLDAIDNNQTMHITLNYSPSYPIPLYAGVFNHNEQGLNYSLRVANNSYPFSLGSFITWADYNNSVKLLKDKTFNTGAGVYMKSRIEPTTFRQTYGNDFQPKLLKTILYWPMSETNLNNLNIVIADQGNHPKTKLYTRNDVNGTSQTINLDGAKSVESVSAVSLVYLYGIIDSQTSKACMISGLTSVIIKWDKDRIDIDSNKTARIITNFNAEIPGPEPDQSTTTTGGGQQV